MSTDDSTEYRPRRAALPADDEVTSEHGETPASTPRARRGWDDEPAPAEGSGGSQEPRQIQFARAEDEAPTGGQSAAPATPGRAGERRESQQWRTPAGNQPTAPHSAGSRSSVQQSARQPAANEPAASQDPAARPSAPQAGTSKASAPQTETAKPAAPQPAADKPSAQSAARPVAAQTQAASEPAAGRIASDAKTADQTPAAAPAAPAAAAFSRDATGDQAPRRTEETAERPDNPFAPKADEAGTRGRFSRQRKDSPAEEAPVGRRAAAAPARRMDRRNATAITVSAIAAVSIIAVLVSYGLWALNRNDEPAPAAQVGATPGPVLSDASLITDGMAKEIDPSRTWTIKTTQHGATETSPGAACMVTLPTGQPSPKITELRQLEASGDDKTAALHRADAFATADEAIQFFNFRSNEIGGCAGAPLYVERGLDVGGVGNQAVGVRLVLQDQHPEYHTVILVRTGRVVDVLDVARTDHAIEGDKVLAALAPAINRQCSPAVGLCTGASTSVSSAVPPPAGDQPGFLASGDIPRISPGVGQWRGNALSRQVNIQGGSGCEALDLATTSNADKREQRIYLLRNDAATPPKFGLDQVVLQMDNANSANTLVDTISKNMQSCDTRTSGASKMTKSGALQGNGVGGSQLKGNWFIVDQKIDQTQIQKHRVSVIAAGNKVIYLRSNPSGTFDFTDDAWGNVAKRAGERATQVR